MWKVSNIKNKEVLDDFYKFVLKPFFDEIINYKILNYLYSSFEEYLFENCKKYKYYEVLSEVIKVTHKKKSVMQYVEDLCNTISLYELFNQRYIFISQNNDLNNYQYNIIEREVNPILKLIFTEVFYTKLFNDSVIWEKINIVYKDYARSIFHSNFKKENGLSICPYCDTDTIISDGNIIIEHFLPKSRYPFVSMHANNLISSCYGCNGIYGKHTDYFIPIYSPYNLQIGENIIFKMDYNRRTISLSCNNNISLSNYIKLFKLEDKYGKENIFNLACSNAQFIFNLINVDNKKNIDKKTVAKYIKFKSEPLTFLTLSVFSDIEEYMKYCTL